MCVRWGGNHSLGEEGKKNLLTLAGWRCLLHLNVCERVTSFFPTGGST
jgi:hypothetical protein